MLAARTAALTRTGARLRCAVAAAVIVLVAARVHAGTEVDRWPASTASPEPLSPWCDVDAEIERLVLWDELPLEALTFRPVDRGELAAWLQASRSASGRGSRPTGFARRRLEGLLADELGAATPGGARPHRPGALIRLREGDRELLAGPYVRLMPVLDDGVGDWTDSSRVGLRAVLRVGHDLCISGGLFAAEVAEGRRFADPLVASTDLILHEERLTVTARLVGLKLRAGRDRHRWGPGAGGTLLLSDDGEPFNFVEYELRIGPHLRFLALTGATSLHQKRYVAAHRLTWTPRRNLSLSLSEGARYEANGPHVLYLAGFVPYTLVERFDLQDNLEDPDRLQQRNNVLWSLDWAWRFRPATILYGELLIDDIGTEDADMPTRGGAQLGVTTAPRWRGWEWTLGLEVTRISRYTYAVYYQDLCRCNWEHQSEPLGYEEGPDVAVVTARCGADVDRHWGGRLWLTHVARGEDRLGDAWMPPGDGATGDPEEGGGLDATRRAWTLSGQVRRTWSIGLSLTYRPTPLMRAGWWGEVRHIEDPAASEEEGWASRTGLVFSMGMH